MADSEQLFQLGGILGEFGNLGLKTAFTMSELDQNKRQEEWSGYVRSRQLQRDRLEDLEQQQYQHIRAEQVQLAADGIKGLTYGGNPADSYAIYKNMHQAFTTNPTLQKIVMSDPEAQKVVSHFFGLANGSVTQKGVGGGVPTLPDGQPYPNLEMLRAHEGKVEGLKDASIIASRIPQWIEVTLPDGTKKTIDQRESFYNTIGYRSKAIHYDVNTGVPTANPGEFDEAGRAALWNTAHGLHPDDDNGYAAMRLQSFAQPLSIGGKDVEFEKYLPRMMGNDASVISQFIAVQPDAKSAIDALTNSGVRVSPDMVRNAAEMRLASGGGTTGMEPFEKSGSHNIPANLSVKYLPSQIGGGALIQTQTMTGSRDPAFAARQMEDQALMEGLQAQGDLTTTFGKSGSVQSFLMRDSVMMDTPDGPKPVIRGDNARLVAKIANGQSLGEGLAELVGVETSKSIMPALEPVVLGMNKKQGEAVAPKIADSLDALEEAVPGIKTVVQNDPSLVAQIDAEENPKAKQLLVTTLVRDAYRTTYDEARGSAGEAVRALQAGASMAGEPVNVFADKLGNGDAASVATMRAAQVDGINAADVFASAMSRASDEFSTKLSAYKTEDARKVISSIEGLNKASNALVAAPRDEASSATYYGSQAEFMRGVADEMAKRPGIAEVGFKNAAPDAAMAMLAKLDAKVLSGIASREESIRKMAAAIKMTPDRFAAWWLGPGHTQADLWDDFKQFVGK